MVSNRTLIIFMAIGIYACQKEEVLPALGNKLDDLPEQQKIAQHEEHDDLSAQMKQRTEKINYDPIALRDPFYPYLLDQEEALKEERRQDKVDSIEKYEIGQYRLTGIVRGYAAMYAMVEDPDGQGYLLHVGSILGKNNGKVIKISKQGVTLIEEVEDEDRQRVLVEKNMTMEVE